MNSDAEERNDSQRAGDSNNVRAKERGRSGFAARLSELIGSESRAKFASRTGISEGVIRRYESGSQPGLINLLKIAEAAGVTVNWLATGEGEKMALPPESQEGSEESGTMKGALDNYREEVRRIRSDIVSAARESGLMPEIENAEDLAELGQTIQTLMYVHNVPYKLIVQLMASIHARESL